MSKQSISTMLYYVCTLVIITVVATKVKSDDTKPIPADRSQIVQWFKDNVQPFTQRKGILDPALEAAESNRQVINVRQDGTGNFKTINEAINSIPNGNVRRVIVDIGPGIYNEKILIENTKPFITLRGTSTARPILQFDGSAKKVGTFNSATLIVMSDYFMAVDLDIKNTTPRPNAAEAETGAQAVALRLSGDKAAIYRCGIFGYQDTLLDESGRHFFMSSYIQGTVDFIFGSGKSLYLQTELHVIKEQWRTVIAAQAKQEKHEDSGFSFVHCDITGDGVNDTYLGRLWKIMSEIVYSYCNMSQAIIPQGWDNTLHPNERQMVFGEYQNTGPGANPSGRVKFSIRLNQASANPFLTLSYIQASKWLLPPDN